jgi:hypothetical protein
VISDNIYGEYYPEDEERDSNFGQMDENLIVLPQHQARAAAYPVQYHQERVKK